ncbi:hypothetical protein KM043_016968 [Ampulex compressa]|nr:hypothetical protein KM043_016968 [Ampulex compressa]
MDITLELRGVQHEGEIVEEDPRGNVWDFHWSISNDPLEREIGSNREDEVRGDAAAGLQACSKKRGCNGKRASESIKAYMRILNNVRLKLGLPTMKYRRIELQEQR